MALLTETTREAEQRINRLNVSSRTKALKTHKEETKLHDPKL